ESAEEFANSELFDDFALAGFQDLYSGSIMAADGSAVTFTILDANGDDENLDQSFESNLIAANDIALNITSVNKIGGGPGDGIYIAAITGNIGLADSQTLWQTLDAQDANFAPGTSHMNIAGIYTGGSFY